MLLMASVVQLMAFAKPPDFSILAQRLASLQSDEAIVQCIVLESMVPRQRLELRLGPPASNIVREARKSGALLGILGRDGTGQETLRYGVQARIESASSFFGATVPSSYFSSHSTVTGTDASMPAEFQSLECGLVAGRRFAVVEPEMMPADEQLFEARVRWLDEGKGTAASIVLANQLLPLISEWKALVWETRRERADGQLDRLLADLGPTPDPEDTDDLAFWVAALINPIPTLGVCKDIRHVILPTMDESTRIKWVHAALGDSIKRMKRFPPGPIEVEPGR